MNNRESADVVIVGAGVAGCSAALALADHYKVLLLDRNASPVARPGDCLPAAAGRLLRRLGVWDHFLKQPHLSALGIQSYWGSPQLQVQDGLRNPDGQSWHLERSAFEGMLRRSAEQRGVMIRAPDGIAYTRQRDDRWHLTLDSGVQLTACWVIDAGGRRAPFARRLGVERRGWDSLVAAWATYPDSDCKGLDASMATVAAAPDGWWYSAPLPHQRRLMAFHTDKSLLSTARWRYLTPFVRAARGCGPMATLLPKNASTIGYHGVTAANSSRLQQAAGPGWAAVGDAALSFDPLSSQGMYNAMATAVQLAELIVSGESVARTYDNQIDRIWAHYLKHRWMFYGMEKRWSHRDFWLARCATERAYELSS